MIYQYPLHHIRHVGQATGVSPERAVAEKPTAGARTCACQGCRQGAWTCSECAGYHCACRWRDIAGTRSGLGSGRGSGCGCVSPPCRTACSGAGSARLPRAQTSAACATPWSLQQPQHSSLSVTPYVYTSVPPSRIHPHHTGVTQAVNEYMPS